MMPWCCWAGTAAVDGRIYVIGGLTWSLGEDKQWHFHYLDGVQMFDAATGKWIKKEARMSKPRIALAAAKTTTGTIVAIGGANDLCTGAEPPKGKCTVTVGFAPSATGTENASVSINSNASNSPNTFSLVGTGR
jgi:hypothetical protein